MLQQTTDNWVNRDNTPPPEFHPAPVVSLAEVIAFIRRRLLMISLTCMATLGIAILYLIITVPTFIAKAQLIVDAKLATADAAAVATIVQSQIEIMKSDGIASAVIEKLGLAQDPEFATGQGSGMISRLLGWSRPETKASAVRRTVESFERKLSAKRVGPTYLVEITFESRDPDRAAQILNAVAEKFITHQVDRADLQDEPWVKDRLNELSTQASAAKKAFEDYSRNRKDAGESAATMDELVAAAESSKSAYDNFRLVLRKMEATRQLSSPVLVASLVSGASPPLRATWPNARIVLGTSIVVGALLGIAIGLLRDLMDRGTRASWEAWRGLQLACIVAVPMVTSGNVWRKLTAAFSGPAQKQANRQRSRNIVRTASPIWAIMDAPQSRFTESLLEIKLAIDSMNRSGERNQVIGTTSAQPGEGKSTVAAALALLMAQAGARVILVDCNLRNRSLSAELAPTASFGILDIMAGAASVSEATWIDSKSQLAFLPVGNNSRPIYMSDVLASEKLNKLYQILRDAYEYVIVDLPAETISMDLRAAAHLLDSLVLVVDAGRMNVGLVERARKICSDMDEIMLGVVLNKADMELVKRYGLRS
ncbi:P-loop NTPase [Bradyrhizobium sp. SSUT18]|uniref:P-loop NTPase n=1 Tax=Bradyrhizobium sp. SSUT18 TaxID=3040602 RepID=UPI00244CD741|nr:P-loop NTPase [Bradyrhizobium sp. SSUT18]MDH2406534.1 P-loop NTPase [Bradyrhizobium sp. SSUT18]